MGNAADAARFQVAAYIRLSREDGDKEESDSVGNQRKLLLSYLDGKAAFQLHDVYVDDGYTGLHFRRPAFQRMLADIDAHLVNCVIVKDLSRIGRDHIETSRFLERVFPEKGVRFIAVADQIDSQKQAYDMLLPLKNLFNEQYARDISTKVSTAIRAKQEAGEFIGAFASYGYKKSQSDKNKLVIDESAAAVVRRIFAMYIQGYGKRAIAHCLNAENIPCPSVYKRLNGENYANCHRLDGTTYWTYATIHTILQREMYTGCMVQGKVHQQMKGKARAVAPQDWIVVPDTHDAIIDKATWHTVQHLLKRQHRDLKLGQNNSVFAGLLTCGDCGRAMAKKAMRYKDGVRHAFYCGTYQRHGKQYCTPHTVLSDALEQIVLRDLRQIVRSMDDLQQLVEQQIKQNAVKKHSHEEQLVQLKRDWERVNAQKKSVYRDYKEDLITKEEFVEYHTDYQKKEDHLQKKIQLLQGKHDKQSEQTVSQHTWIQRLLDTQDITALDRQIVVEMIDGITIYEDHRIVIRYRFSGELAHVFPPQYVYQKLDGRCARVPQITTAVGQ